MKLAEGLQNVKQKISFGAFNRHVLEKIHFLNSNFFNDRDRYRVRCVLK